MAEADECLARLAGALQERDYRQDVQASQRCPCLEVIKGHLQSMDARRHRVDGRLERLGSEHTSLERR